MQALNRDIKSVLDENQIYRIDHYLGKETVQNILVFRFANGIFKPVWNRRYIDHVQITVAETVGVEHCGGYYDHADSGCLDQSACSKIPQLCRWHMELCRFPMNSLSVMAAIGTTRNSTCPRS